MAALLGLTFGIPTVTFQTPAERLAAQRLHLPSPPAIDYADFPMWHFGHTADPVFMGVCTVGYFLERNRYSCVCGDDMFGKELEVARMFFPICSGIYACTHSSRDQ